MAVRIRMKRMGRRHRPFYRVCAVDSRSARDGRVIEYLGHYDPMIPETDARATLNAERIDYWLSVGAQPSDSMSVLIKKYGSNGTHQEQRQAALERLKMNKPTAPAPVAVPKPKPAEPAADASSEGASEGGGADASEGAAAEAPAEDAAAPEAAVAEASGEEKPAEEKTE